MESRLSHELGIKACVLIPCLPSLGGQKITYGQGLEGPWERPPPLDEPQRDGSSGDQVEEEALNGKALRVGRRGGVGNLVGGARP